MLDSCPFYIRGCNFYTPSVSHYAATIKMKFFYKGLHIFMMDANKCEWKFMCHTH